MIVTIPIDTKFRGSKLLLAAASSAIALSIATPAAAQDAAPTTVAPQDEEIIVTGIRASLQRNLDIKRESSGVVDVISAEDIGKFPDSNVASALQRLPGVAIQRSGSRGDATGVSIRGFGGDFVRTLNDGRQLSTATGGRGVDFTTVGADFVGRLSVYKTPDVELSTSAIGGTIDISLPKPLDRDGFVLAASASGSIQSRDKGIVPTGGLLLSNTFADGTIGVLGSVAYSRRDTESNQVFIPGWIGQQGGGRLGLYSCQLTATCTPAQMTDANRTGTATWAPQQQGINQQSTQDKRIDGRIAVQWQPSDDILLTIDDNYSRQTVSSQTYGYAAWFNGSDLRNVKVDSNGTVVDFNQFGTPMDFNANRSSNVYESNQVGANLKIDLAEHLKFEADAAFARATRNPGGGGYNDSMDIGYGGTNGATTVLGANTGVTILGPSKDYVPQIHDVGPAGNVSRFLDTTVVGSHVIVRGTNYNYDTLRQFRGAIGWEKDGFMAKLGGQYIDDTLYQQNDSTFTNGVFASRSGYGTCSGRTGGSSGGICPLPAGVYQGTVSTSGFIPGYSGNLAPGFFVYDPYAVYKLLEASGGSVAPSLDPGSKLKVHEKTWAIWFKTKFEAEIAGMPFTVAAGIRNETTNLETQAVGRRVLGLSIPAGDPTLIQPNPALGPNKDGYSATTDISRKSNYSYLLPSIDAKLQITPNLVLRADASRTLTRPALANLRPTVTLGTLRVGSLSASGGNPDLKPYLSDNFDLGMEWYYQPNSYFAVNAYMKHITNFIVGGVTRGPIDGVIDPSTGQTAVFSINAQINGPEATVKGVEVALQHVFGNSGFGFSANATLPSTNRNYDASNVSGGSFTITGLAKSANFVGFYDKNGFQIRGAVNWRDEYLSGLGQGQGGVYGAEPVYVDAQIQIDASASYDITKQFTVFGEVTNINNSTYSTHGRFSNQALDIWSYGRRFTGGVRFRY
ncbi:TonB-dependent receptor [Sphingomonas sp. CJ20]